MTPQPPPTTPGPTVSAAPAPRSAWHQHWKDIATMTHGILPHEPRLKTVLDMIDRCTIAHEKNDEPAFLRAKTQLSNFMTASTPRPKPAPASPPLPTAQSA